MPNGGSCLVSRENVQQPIQFGGLGIHNFEQLGWTLCIRWLWFEKTDASCSWAGLPTQVPHNAKALFDIAVDSIVGNGETIKFWSDRWLQGKTATEWAPNLIKLIPNRTLNQRTVAQALTNRSWVADIRGALTVQVLIEYLQLWELVDDLALQHDTPGQHRWRLIESSSYTSKSAYTFFFTGTIKFAPWRRIWKRWAPLRYKFFIWLAVKNRCWTAYRLAKRGLPHPASCPLCDQAEETIQHTLVGCVFARQVWTMILYRLGLLLLLLSRE